MLNRVIVILLILSLSNYVYGSVLNNFDDIPVTETGAIPQDGTGWQYGSSITNAGLGITTSGWYETAGYSLSPSTHNTIEYFLNTDNTIHIGFSTYGYLEIDDFSVSGNSLRVHVTGGKTSIDGVVTEFGDALTNKETFLTLSETSDPTANTTENVGHPYIYFKNTSNDPDVYFEESQSTNRLSFYIYTPQGLNNGSGGYLTPPNTTFHVGPYTGTASSHWYHQGYFEGGGWTHVLIDGHPQHNNSWDEAADYPYPSRSLRNMDDYFNIMYRFYITFLPYTGFATPPYDIWIDEVQFVYDSEPQNNETIASPSISYNNSTHVFQVGFNDKYKNNQYSYSTYELRYSFSPITNANWSSATPALIEDDPRYSAAQRTTVGEFGKNTPYYQAVWTSFKLNVADESSLTEGTTVYFAIKDVGQTGGDGNTPRAYREGRDYAAYSASFDYAGDQPVLNLIKRIDYIIPSSLNTQQTIHALMLSDGPAILAD